MILRRPIFPGDSELDQLHRMFRVLGTPTEDQLPGLQSYPNYNVSCPGPTPTYRQEFWPVHEPIDLRAACNTEPGIWNFIAHTVVYDPEERVSAGVALTYPMFQNLPKEKLMSLLQDP